MLPLSARAARPLLAMCVAASSIRDRRRLARGMCTMQLKTTSDLGRLHAAPAFPVFMMEFKKEVIKLGCA
jgi:hypothetical protein